MMLGAAVMAWAWAAAAGANQPIGGSPGGEAGMFTVRPGYEVSVAVLNIPEARFLEMDSKGTLYVTRSGRGDILALRDENGDGVFERRAAFVTGKPTMHGVCVVGDDVWFSTSGSIHRAKDTDGDLVADSVTDVITEGLPKGGAHWYRPILVTTGEQGAIYTGIGDSGNADDQAETDRQKIWRYNLDGSGKTLFASGIRNTEKLRLRPGTTEIWGVDHGSDWFGRDLGEVPGDQAITDLNPPDELNLYEQGGFYGHPVITGNRVPRPEYLRTDEGRAKAKELAAGSIAPAFSLPPHWAGNGFTFIEPAKAPGPGAMPEDHHGDLLVCFHGSWNSTNSVGYCVARVLFDDVQSEGGRGVPYGILPIVTTLEPRNEVVLARPVDAVQALDGTILFSSDQPGRVYRIKWVGTRTP